VSDRDALTRPAAHLQFTGTEGIGALSSRAIALYAVLVAAAGFVPVPIVDDLLPNQLVRQLLRTILRQTGRRYSTSLVRPLYAGEGCLAGVLGILLRLPLDILLYPIRKFVRIIRGVRALSQRLVSTYLLGHTVNRYVAKDWLASDCPGSVLFYQSCVLREAFDAALKETNPVVFADSVASVLGGLHALPRAAWRTSRELLRQSRTSERDGKAAEVPTLDGPVAGAANGVERALDDPDVQRLLAEFDGKVDREVARLLSGAETE